MVGQRESVYLEKLQRKVCQRWHMLAVPSRAIPAMMSRNGQIRLIMRPREFVTMTHVLSR